MKKKKIINSPSSPSPPVASWSEPHSHCPQTGRSSGRACCRSEAEGKQRAKSVMMKQHSWDDKPVSPTLCLVFCRLFRKIFRISSSRLLEMLGMARRRAVPRDSKFLRKEKTNGKKFNCEIERTNKQIFRKNFFFFFTFYTYCWISWNFVCSTFDFYQQRLVLATFTNIFLWMCIIEISKSWKTKPYIFIQFCHHSFSSQIFFIKVAQTMGNIY